MRKLVALALIALAAGCLGQGDSGVPSATPAPKAFTNDDFLAVLGTDPDMAAYLANNTAALEVTKLSPADIAGNLSDSNSNEYYLYEALPMKELYKVEFVNAQGRGFQAILDMDESKVLKMYGLIRMGVGA